MNKDAALAELRKIIKPGQTVYCILRHVSSSGMSRVIDLAVIDYREEREWPLKPEAEAEYPGQRDLSGPGKLKRRWPIMRRIGHLAAAATGHTYDNRNHYGVRVSGCGMDMGFSLVYDLGRALWPKGTRKPHGTRNGEPDRDGGYALKHEWL